MGVVISGVLAAFGGLTPIQRSAETEAFRAIKRASSGARPRGASIARLVGRGSRTAAVGTVTCALLASLIVAGSSVAAAAPTTGGDIKGQVFRDFNSNGTRNTTDGALNATTSLDLAVDTPVSGVRVVLTCLADNGADGVNGTVDDIYTAAQETTSAPDGTWSIAATGSPCRVEFDATTLPVGFETTSKGTDNGGLVQFAAAGATNVSLGVNLPADFCEDNPLVCQTTFNRLASTQANAGVGSVSTFSYGTGYTGTGHAGGDGFANAVAGGTFYTGSDVGVPLSSRQPLANRAATVNATGPVYGVAWHRPSRTVYVGAYLKPDGVCDGLPGAACNYPLAAPDYGFGPLGIGGVYRIDIDNPGAPATPALPPVPNAGAEPYTADLANATAANTASGKVSLGGLQVSGDGRTLYVANLNDRTVYQLALNADGTAGGGWTPYLDFKTIPPTSLAGTACPAADVSPFGLGWKSSGPNAGLFVGVTCTGETARTATSSFSSVYSVASSSYVVTTPARGGWNYSTTQGMHLSDFEFEGDDIILGFRGRDYWSASGSYGVNGNVQRACYDTGTASWLLEVAAGPSGSDCAGKLSNDDSPSLGGEINEWYYEEAGDFGESASGGLAGRPGSNYTMATMRDPMRVYSSGVYWLNDLNGGTDKGFESIQDGLSANSLGKRGQMADIEVLCSLAPLEVGDYVWEDGNGNGIQDPGEQPLQGVQVTLTGPNGETVTATTDAAGHYLFSNDTTRTTSADGALQYGLTWLVPETQGYTFTVQYPEGYNATTNPSPDPDSVPGTWDPDSDGESIDNDGKPNAAGTAYVMTFDTPTAGDNRHHYDFGFNKLPPVSIGNQVWWDTDNDGTRDAAEVPIPGVKVELFQDVDGNGVIEGAEQVPIAIATTGPDGLYLFDERTDAAGAPFPSPQQLYPGSYVVGIAASNFATGSALAGSHSSGTSVDGAGTLTEAAPAPIEAADGSGSVDSDDSGTEIAAGAPFYAGGVLSASVKVTTGKEPTAENPYNNDNTKIADADSQLTIDFGFYRQTISNLVWTDSNDNGVVDGTEVGRDGVTVRLFAADGTTQLASTVTANGGLYAFAGLAEGNYIVKIDAPVGTRSSTDPAGAAFPNNATDSDDNGVTAGQGTISSALINMDPGTAPNTIANATGSTTNTRVDFGLVELVSIGDKVWLDTDRDGIQDSTEPAIPGVTVSLYDGATKVGSVVTGADGIYVFANLDPNRTYTVRLDSPADYTTGPLAGLQPTTPGSAGSTEATDSDGTLVNGLVETVAKAPATGVDTSFDFGFVSRPISIGNQVWWDTDNDSTFDTGVEKPIAGVTVELFADVDGNGLIEGAERTAIATTTTDGNGLYLFTVTAAGIPLTAGSYVVGIAAANFADGAPLDGAWSSGTPRAANGTIAETAPAATDANADSVDDGTMQPAGAAFYAGGVLSGVLKVTAGGEPTTENPDNNGGTGVANADSNLTVDFGFYSVGVGNVVWADNGTGANANNGVFDVADPAEIGLAGVTVELWTADGLTKLDTAVTGPGGAYSFGGQPAGDYIVKVTAPTGYTSSKDPATGADPNNATDSDDNGTGTGPGVISSAVVSLVPGGATMSVNQLTGTSTDPRVDFGLVQTASIGDYVFEDLDHDGVQDSTDKPLADVTVTIFEADGVTPAKDASGAPIAPIVTGADGLYQFTNLTPGRAYTVTFTPSDPTLIPSPTGAGSTATDSNGPTGTSPVLAPGQVVTDLDAGFFQPVVSVGDFVWFDTDGDGTQDPTEQGLAGATLTLYLADGTTPVTVDADGVAVTPIVTGAGGAYLFDNLPLGTYVVKVTPPTGYVPTITGGGTTATDSSTDQATSAALSTDGAKDLTLDFGFVTPVIVGDFVWIDQDGDGVQDPGEPGLAGVTLTLTNADGSAVTDVNGNPVAPITTGDDGAYGFVDLPPGQYTVTVTAVTAGMVPTQSGKGTTATDSSTGEATSRVLPAGERDLTLDFGFYAPVSVGDLVWEDLDGDGIQDASEPGIAGVVLHLVKADGSPALDMDGNPVADITTGPDGLYSFTDLPPGQYTVAVVSVPTGYLPTKPGVGATDTDSSTNQATSTVLPSGTRDLTLDFGFVKPVSVGNFVWHDQDGDGTQDASEPGLSATLRLTKADGTTATDMFGNPVADVTSTAGTGAYLFTNLPPGQYVVTVVTPPPGMVTTLAAQGTDPTLDSGSAAGEGTATSAVLSSGAQDMTLDFGFLTPVTVGDYVWHDQDADGIQEATEPGLAGVTLHLTRADGTAAVDMNGAPVADLVTGADGKYSFTNLPPGDYTVTVASVPAGYTPTKTGAGTPASDSSTDEASTPVLVSGGSDLTLDFGFFQPASLGNRVWFDADHDGVQDVGEAGIPGVTVNVYDADGELAGTAITAADGTWLVGGLTPNTAYSVKLDNPADQTGALAGYHLTGTDSPAGTDATDSDAAPVGGFPTITTATTGASGSTVDTYDVGFWQPLTLGNLVWLDTDNDGAKDATETGLAGLRVNLYQGTTLVASTLTTATGHYLFTGLLAGDYVVEVVHPATLVSSSGTNGSATGPSEPGQTDADDGDDNGTIGTVTSVRSGTIMLTHGGAPLTEPDAGDVADPYAAPDRNSYLNWDFGLYQPVSLGDTVWHDQDGDGTLDATEPKLAGVTVRLFDGTGTLVATTTTDANGRYLFDHLTAGDYVVEVDLTSPALTGMVSTVDTADSADPNSDLNTDDNGVTVTATTVRSGTVTLTVGGEPTNDGDTSTDSNLSVDFGFYNPSSIGNFVWDDLDGDGIQDAGEPGLGGVTVTLLDGDGNPVGDPIQTAADGSYLFAGLIPGTYSVQFTKPGGSTISSANRGTDDATDSDADPTTGTTQQVTLASGQSNLTLDAGIWTPATISGVVYLDDDNDGEKDPSEAPIPGSVVTLTGVDSLGNPITKTVTTGADGTWTFADLPPGTYSVTKTLTAGNLDGKDTSGTEAGASDDTIVSSITLESGDTATGYQLGELRPASTAGVVWEDLDNDGVIDPSEKLLAGVTVTLTGTDDRGNPVTATATTGTDGSYLFPNLRPGSYSVTETQPATHLDGKDVVGSLGGTAGNDKTTAIPLAAGQAGTGYDFGELLPASISGVVYADDLPDGDRDADDPPIAGVTITLTGTDDLGNPVKRTTTTDADGNFTFTDLRPGTYTVTETQPQPYLDGVIKIGTAGGTKGDDAINAVVLDAGENATGYEFGEVAASIGDTVYRDLDGDGTQDTGEPGIPGVKVTVTDSSGKVVHETTTDAEGRYLVPKLPADTYTVTLSPTTLPEGLAQTFDVDGLGTPHTATVTLAPNQQRLDVDFGYREQLDLKLTKTAPSSASPGQLADWTLVVTNEGPSAGTGPFTVTDDLPASLTFVSVTGTGWTCTAAGQTVTCTHAGPISKGGSLPLIRLTTRVAADFSGELTNRATVRGVAVETSATNNDSAGTVRVLGIQATGSTTTTLPTSQAQTPVQTAVRGVVAVTGADIAVYLAAAVGLLLLGGGFLVLARRYRRSPC